MKKIVIIIFLYLSVLFSQPYGTWIIIDSTKQHRLFSSSVVLPNGDVLVTGGAGHQINYSSCEVYDTATKMWRFTNPMIFPRSHHKSILLDNGKVLVIGGFTYDSFSKSCELYNYQNETWALTDSLKVLREFGYTVNKLHNSSILIVGGWNRVDKALRKCEIYDVNTNQWRLVDSTIYPRNYHTATVLLDGRVLIAGGASGGGNNLGSCEIYDPQTDSFYLVRQMNIPRFGHSATLLPDGKVLVAGGRNDFISWLKSVEVYDPQKNLWFLVDSLIFAREDHYGLILNDSLILFSGGGFMSGTWEIYNYKTFKPLYADWLPIIKDAYEILPLHNGNIINVGGAEFLMIGDDLYIYPSRQCLLFIPLLTFVEKFEPSIQSFILYQNYPNPFNPITKIRYSLKEKVHVNLRIYDLIGREILTLVNEPQEAGVYEVEFNASNYNLNSGVYFYQMRAGGYTSIKKMVYLK